jgi:hypothetical protein
MFLVPVLLAIDAADAAAAERLAAADVHERAIHIGEARRLSLASAALADFELRVYANRIELPPAERGL